MKKTNESASGSMVESIIGRVLTSQQRKWLRSRDGKQTISREEIRDIIRVMRTFESALDLVRRDLESRMRRASSEMIKK